MKRPKQEPGTFVRIALPHGSFGYGRLLHPPDVAFYNHRTSEPSSDLDEIASKPVQFAVAVKTSGLKQWEPIG